MKKFGGLLYNIYYGRPKISICNCDCKRCRDTGVKYMPSDSTFEFCDYCDKGPLIKRVIKETRNA